MRCPLSSTYGPSLKSKCSLQLSSPIITPSLLLCKLFTYLTHRKFDRANWTERVKFLDDFCRKKGILPLKWLFIFLCIIWAQVTLKPVRAFTNSSVNPWIFGSFSEIGAIFCFSSRKTSCKSTRNRSVRLRTSVLKLTAGHKLEPKTSAVSANQRRASHRQQQSENGRTRKESSWESFIHYVFWGKRRHH